MWGFWLGGLPLLLGTLVVVWVASGPREPADTAARILDERLARGEPAVREHREARAALARTRPLAPRTPRRPRATPRCPARARSVSSRQSSSSSPPIFGPEPVRR